MAETKKSAAELVTALQEAVKNVASRQSEYNRFQTEFADATNQLNRAKEVVSELRKQLDESLNDLAGEPANPLVTYSK